ncbi:hypothetical protein PIB30_045645 [Stylosanthes scabra]|uniref:DUF4283 domain-containing protein n=1 Tax=Stylosanthes scabra TaxID=79078 RepID=A0ABU6WFY6_9FABA|nr:hypothetical protein [Stylosanthes scabra]
MANEEQDVVDRQVVYIDPLDVEGIDVDNLNMVGKVLTDKEISYNSIRAAIMGMWGNLDGVVISDVAKNKIWNGVESIYAVRHNFMHLWVQMHGVPLSYMNKLTAEKLGRAIGTGDNKKYCKLPMAVAHWDPLKPRYTSGLSTRRPPPLVDIQEQEAEVELGDSDDSS